MTIPNAFFIVIDILIIGLYLFMIWRAYKHGFVFELLSFLGFVLAFFAAWFISPILAEHFPLLTPDPTTYLSEQFIVLLAAPLINILVWFVLILILIKIICALILPIFKLVSKIPVLGFVNRLAGSLFGIINATVWVLILSMFLSLPLIENGMEVRENTVIKYVGELTDQTLLFVSEHVDLEAIEKIIGQEINDVDSARDIFEAWLAEQGIVNE